MIRNRFTKVLYGATRIGALAAIAACADRSTVSPLAPSLGDDSRPLAIQISVADQPSVPGPSVVGAPASYPLYAGGGGSSAGTQVGTVDVYSTSLGGNLYRITVTYNVYAGICLSETHLSIQLTAGGVPQNNGNPTPGQFEQKSGGGCDADGKVTYTKDINMGADNGVVIAAHAVVSGTGQIGAASYVSGSSLATTVVSRRVGNSGTVTNVGAPAVDAWEPTNDPADPTLSFWDSAIFADGAAGQWLVNNNADWIWESFRSQDPVQGTVIQMSAGINSPVAQSGTFRITCDNGYRVALNGVTLTSGDGASSGYGTQLSTAFHNALTTNLAAGFDLKQANVSADGWQSVESYSVNLLQGNNTFTIYAANEYQNTDDTHPGYPSGPAARSAGPDPVGTSDLNPAGCIFGLQTNGKSVSIGQETAWGAPNGFSGATTGAGVTGGNFGGRNWATYFTYQVK